MEPSATSRRHFTMRKLHSLTGVVPIGAYLMVHLWTSAKALQGQQAYDEAMAEFQRLPYLVVLEVLGIYLPLLFHAGYGIVLSLSARPNVGAYPFAKNWAYVMQRVTGIVSLAFIGYHVWQFRVQVLLNRMAPSDFFPELCALLSSTSRFGIPLVAVAYLLGTAAVAYHFANGLHGFCFSWGVTVSRRASRVAAGVFGVLGIVLFLLGANTVLYFATGSSVVLSLERPLEDGASTTCRDHGPALVSRLEERTR